MSICDFALLSYLHTFLWYGRQLLCLFLHVIGCVNLKACSGSQAILLVVGSMSSLMIRHARCRDPVITWLMNACGWLESVQCSFTGWRPRESTTSACSVASSEGSSMNQHCTKTHARKKNNKANTPSKELGPFHYRGTAFQPVSTSSPIPRGDRSPDTPELQRFAALASGACFVVACQALQLPETGAKCYQCHILAECHQEGSLHAPSAWRQGLSEVV